MNETTTEGNDNTFPPEWGYWETADEYGMRVLREEAGKQ
jgi:hypothetical protein